MIKITEPLQLLGNHGELIQVTVTNFYYEYPTNSPTIIYSNDLDLWRFGGRNYSPTDATHHGSVRKCWDD